MPLRSLTLAALLGICAVLWAQPPMGKDPGKEPPRGPEAPAKPPANPEQELLTEIQRLRQRLGADLPIAPSECHLKGKVESNHVQIQARFVIVTELPGRRIFLGCGKKAQAIRASLDGATPLLRADNEGLSVLIDEPTEAPRQLTLDLSVPLVRRESGRGFDLDLPRSAITTLDLILPPGVKDVRLGDAPLEDTLLQSKNSRVTGSLGATDRLQMTWKEPAASASPASLLTAEGKIEVRIDPGHRLSVRTVLTLDSRGGPAQVWRLLVPADAEIQLSAEDEALLAGPIETTAEAGASLRTLRLKEPQTSPLNVTVVTPPGPPLTRGKQETVGPFVVLDAARQTGTMVVYSQASDLQLRLHLHGDTMPREITPEEEKLGVLVRGFKYDRVPTPPKGATSKPSPDAHGHSLLDIEVERVRGLLETRVSHVLRLVELPNGPGTGMDRWHWEVQTTIRATVAQPGVELLEIQMPKGCTFVPLRDTERWPDPILDAMFDEARSVVQLRLAREGPKTFSVTLRGQYDQTFGDTAEATLPLPRPLDTAMGPGPGADFQIELLTDSRDLELTRPDQGTLPLAVSRQTPWVLAWQPYAALDRPVEQIVAGWRPYRPEIRTVSTVDLTLTSTEAQITQEILIRYPHMLPARAALRVPSLVSDRLGIHAGGTLLRGAAPVRPEPMPLIVNPPNVDFQTLIVQLDPLTPSGEPTSSPRAPTGTGYKEARLVVKYSYILPEEAFLDRNRSAFAVPLVYVADATQGETVVRIWSEPGILPTLTGGSWSDQPVEEVPGVMRLPVLVLRSQRLAPTLSLRLGDTSLAPALVWIKRALIRVEITSEREHHYRASFLLSQLLARHLDVELPVPVRAAGLTVTLNGLQVDPETVDEAGERSDSGRIARLHLSPSLARSEGLLELSYNLQPGRTESGTLWTPLRPPLVQNAPTPILTRWKVTLPPDWVPIWPEEGPGAGRVWTWEGWLIGSRPAASAMELERWILGSERGEPASIASEANVPPTLVCWRGDVGSLTIVHVPRRAWLLACSLSLLVLGLGFIFWWQRVLNGEGSAFWLGAMLVLLFLTGVVAALVWPTTAAAVVHGSQPGALVLILAVILQWLAHERQRRRVVFLPSFSRERPAEPADRGPSTVSMPAAPVPAATGRSSSQQQKLGNDARPREPSTVDVPPIGGSSSKMAGSSAGGERRP